MFMLENFAMEIFVLENFAMKHSFLLGFEPLKFIHMLKIGDHSNMETTKLCKSYDYKINHKILKSAEYVYGTF